MKRLALQTLLLLAAAGACAAASADTLTSSASLGASFTSASSASVSDSIEGSSKSSTGAEKKAAAGIYRLLALTQTPQRPGLQGLSLQEEASSAAGRAPQAFVVWVPQATVQAAGLAAGQKVQVREADYGFAFARVGQADQALAPFFLALHDSASRDLRTTVIAL